MIMILITPFHLFFSSVITLIKIVGSNCPYIISILVDNIAMFYSRLVEPSRHGTDKATSRD